MREAQRFGGNLSGTKREITAIKPGLGTGAKIVLGPDVTQAAVRSAPKGKRVILFATHGFVCNDVMRGLH